MNEEYPWLCSSIKDTSEYLNSDCDDKKTTLANILTDEGLGSRRFQRTILYIIF